MHNGKRFTETHENHFNAAGPIFQVTNLNRNLAQFRPSEIQYQPDPTARNGSLDMWQPDMWRTYHKCFDREEI